MNYPRRHFLKTAAAAGAVGWLTPFGLGYLRKNGDHTSTGSSSPMRWDAPSPHEHVLVDFGGAQVVSPDRYDADEAFNKILPYLNEIKALGAQSFAECTPNYLGARRTLAAAPVEGQRTAHADQHRGSTARATACFCPTTWPPKPPSSWPAAGLTSTATASTAPGIRPGFIKIGCEQRPAQRSRPQAGGSGRPDARGNRVDHCRPHRGCRRGDGRTGDRASGRSAPPRVHLGARPGEGPRQPPPGRPSGRLGGD